MSKKVTDVTYEIHMPDKKNKSRIFHVNMLQKWDTPIAECLLMEELIADSQQSQSEPDDIVTWPEKKTLTDLTWTLISLTLSKRNSEVSSFRIESTSSSVSLSSVSSQTPIVQEKVTTLYWSLIHTQCRVLMTSSISILDLCKGYYQVPVDEESVPKTAFVTPLGKYEFIRMLFGLVGTPAAFQCMMNTHFQQPI